jgi:hypothetical protein
MDVREGKSNSSIVRRRALLYGLLVAVLLLGAYPAHRAIWRGNAELHTLLETISSLLALTAGALALVRFYAKKEQGCLERRRKHSDDLEVLQGSDDWLDHVT